MSDVWVAEVLDHATDPLPGPTDVAQAPRPPRVARVPGTRSMLEALEPIDVSVLYNPLRWLRWRREVRRLGPYAPDYDGRVVLFEPVAQRVGFAVLITVVFAVVVALAR